MSGSRNTLAVPSAVGRAADALRDAVAAADEASASPVVGRNQCSLMLMANSFSSVSLRSRDRAVEVVGEERARRRTRSGSSPASTNASAISCSESVTSVADRGRLRRTTVDRAARHVGRQPGLLRPDLRPLVAVRVAPHLRLGDPLQVVLERRPGRLVVEGVAGWRPGRPCRSPARRRRRGRGRRPRARPGRCTGPRSPTRRRGSLENAASASAGCSASTSTSS